MADKEIKEGDQASWQWGGGRPGGTVAEVKEQGEIAIQSKKGNTIKKNASPDNPAVHLSRPGNDVVKRASELDVDEKGAKQNGGGDKGEEKDKAKDEKKDAESKAEANGEKEKTDKSKPEQTNGDKKTGEKRDVPDTADDKDAKKQKTAGDEDKANGEAKKKGPGRPKKGEAKAAPEKKAPKAAANGDNIGSRTRSKKTA